MAGKSKAAIAAAEYNAVIGDVYDFVPDATWDGKEWKDPNGRALGTNVIKWTRVPSQDKPALRASDIKGTSKDNPLSALYDKYTGMWAAVLVAMDVFRCYGFARAEGYADAIARWLTENGIPFKVSIKDGKEYVVCADKKLLSKALGCQ